MQHLYGIAILLLGCGALVSIILWLEWICTKAELKIKNLKAMEEEKKIYTEADLISFGNYVLSDRRRKHIEEQHLIEVVGDWDIANWNAQE